MLFKRKDKMAQRNMIIFVSIFVFFLLYVLKVDGQEKDVEKPILFVYNNIAYGQIVIADRPDLIGINTGGWMLDKTRSTRYAAEFLQEYIEKITGVKIPIVTESSASRSRPLILVGRSSLTDFVEADRKKLPPEGFIIRRKDNRIAIVGEIAPENDIIEYRNVDRGTLFGVYEFLEQFCGVRWYFPDELGVIVPKANIVEVKGNVNIVKSPYFKMRTGGLYPPPEWDINPFIKPGNTTGFWMNHTYGDVWEKYVAENFPGDPDIFATGPDGKKMNRPCYSNLKNLEIDMKRVADWDEKRITSWWSIELVPSEKYVRFLPADLENIYHCHCEKCQSKWISGVENSSLSNLIFGYAGKFAEAIAKKYPGRRLAAGAYSGFLYPPTDMKIPENMDIMICTVKGNAKLVAPGHWKHNTELIEEWLKAVNGNPERLFLWEYFVYPSNNAPNLYPHTMKKWFQFLKGKVSGAFNNGYNPTREPNRYRLHILNAWLWHKLLWNPDEDVDHLMDQFYKDLFGPAYEPMKTLFATAIERWEGYDGWGTGLNPGAVSYVDTKIIYRDIYPLEIIQKMEQCFDNAVKLVPPESIYLKRINYFREAFEPFFKEGRSFHQVYNRQIERPVYKVKKVIVTPVIDGRLNDPVWEEIEKMHLVKWETGEEPPVDSIIKMVHDGKNLYLGATLRIPLDGKLISMGEKRGDTAIFTGDHFIIDLDLRKKKVLQLPDIYRIAVNPEGLLTTGIQTLPVVYNNIHYSNWNEYWAPEEIKVKTEKSKDYWNIEMSIPFSSFANFDPEKDNVIKAQLIRVNKSEPRGVFSWSAMFTETYEYEITRMGNLVLLK